MPSTPTPTSIPGTLWEATTSHGHLAVLSLAARGPDSSTRVILTLNGAPIASFPSGAQALTYLWREWFAVADIPALRSSIRETPMA